MLEDENLNETASEIQLGGQRRVGKLSRTHMLDALFHHVMRKRFLIHFWETIHRRGSNPIIHPKMSLLYICQ